ncbi:MAG: peptide-methionine (R)-S-oxide reductase MsrB [Patescibacteria group bacterium]
MNDVNGLKNMPQDYWKKKLTPEEYNVLREKGTEAPFTGKFYKNFEKGVYMCGACGQQLFSSDTKFDSECGWPSFDKSLEGNVEFRDDNSFGMQRTEVLCKNCGGHLGHVFDDGPTNPSAGSGHSAGKRFCINSISLNFKPKNS